MSGTNFEWDFGKRLQDLRKKAGIKTITELESRLKKSGCGHASRETLSKIENGTRTVRGDMVVHLSQILGVSCDELLTGKETKFLTAEEATGLSSEAIKNLHQLQAKPGFSMEILNEILSSPDLCEDITFHCERVRKCYEDVSAGLKKINGLNPNHIEKTMITYSEVSYEVPGIVDRTELREAMEEYAQLNMAADLAEYNLIKFVSGTLGVMKAFATGREGES